MTDRKSEAGRDGEFNPAPVDEFAFEPTALERANAAIARLKEAYAEEWAPAAIAEMYEALVAARRDRLARRSNFDRIYRLAHDMKGQGGTFGFPLLTELGESLCRLTAGREDAGDGEFALVRAHIDAARTIVIERIDGDGGEAGRKLLAELRHLMRAHLH